MGALVKLLDIVLFPFLLTIALAAPLMDFQAILPHGLYPDYLINLKQWYTREFGDYLFVEKPNFFVGLVWLELLFQWPLTLINLYGILGAKSWLPTTCLIFGASVFTSTVAISTELILSGKASDKMLTSYLPFLGFGVLATLRGLMPPSGKATSGSAFGRRPELARKKKA
ncbi:hypothetical protein HS088_TW06G00573 [Tripterygium wilfordii]|uniref:EXPERA domain-containing protein n=1 Tax=Tripterygium wilfordii TaxID=458696 RepID=A0A7J7DJ68_TRIWF|nr:sigma intracellular receptor 2-like [Tripterygium wilfordii]KAF5746402.1 hypothetical protein HS088_TW06G00573 [Tripterygium wilfordii]